MTLSENLQLKSIAINESMGVCACTTLTNATSHSKPIGQTSLRDASSRRFAVSVVSFDLALRIFSDLERMAARTGGSLVDGCYARAQEMAYALEKRGIIVGKIMVRGRFRVLTDRVKKGSVDWGFHVAPVIVIDDGEKRGVWVLDPSLFSEPVPIEGWLALLMQNPRAKLDDVFLTNRFVFHPNHKARRITNWREIDLKTAKAIIRDLSYTESATDASPIYSSH